MSSQNRRRFNPTKRGSSYARRLHVETLEDRRLLAVFSVDNLDDSGAGSLRQAILDANADTVADEITFSVNGTIDLASQLPTIKQPLTITGPGADLLTLDAGDGTDNLPATGDGYGIFLVANSTAILDVAISGLTLTGGDTGTVSTSTNSGGAIRNLENLTISSSIISRNAAPSGGGINNQGVLTVIDSTIEENRAITGHGGGIYSFGNSTIKSSTLSGNTASGRGGGIYSGINQTLTVTNSTVSGNTAEALGGGIANIGALNLASSTITKNVAGQSGGGISSFGPSDVVNATSSIVAGNMAGSSDNISIIGGLTTNTHNLIDGDPLLGPLADNGGPTKTHALLPGSPALDAGLTPVHDYELDGSLADTMGGPDLVALGGTLTASGYDFEANEGLNLSSANIAPDEYTIEIDFSFDDLSSFQKVLDFKDLVADAGLYTHDDTLRFYSPHFISGNILSVDTLHHLVLSRDGVTEEVRASIDGTEAFRFVDTGDAAVFSATDQIIRFFQDDTPTSQGEAESGFVDRIRLFDAALELNDQRGATYNRVVGSAIDIGAYEAQVAPSADFDTDGDVDGADFLAWQRGFNTPNATRADGNSDDDTDTDASDLAAWTTTFGQQEQVQEQVASPLVAPITDSAKLIDAALATEWLDFTNDDQPATPVTQPTPTADTIAKDFVLETTPTAPAASTSAEAESLATQSYEVDETTEPWLSEQLLQQVFN